MRAASVFSVSVDAYRSEGSLETFQNHTLGNYNWLLDSVVRQALYDNRGVAELRRYYDVPLCVCCVIWARACACPFVAMFAISKGGSTGTCVICRGINGVQPMATGSIFLNVDFSLCSSACDGSVCFAEPKLLLKILLYDELFADVGACAHCA